MSTDELRLCSQTDCVYYETHITSLTKNSLQPEPAVCNMTGFRIICIFSVLITLTGSYATKGTVNPPDAQPARNIALRGISTQSSTNSYFGSARNANDGSLGSNSLRSQCSYTKKDSEPWWMVDLKGIFKVFSVAVTNRVLECCRERIFGAEIRIGNDPSKGGTLNPRCGVITSIESGETLSFSCDGMIGQYVTVTIPGREEELVLCEVQVYGVPASSLDEVIVPKELKTPNGAPNVAVKGISQQSSLYNMFGESKNAIDGSLESNFLYIQCAGTSVEDNPWWMVDLKSVFTIFTVTVTNRGDCCADRINGAQIRIGNSGEQGGTSNPICATITSLNNGETVAFQCDGMKGQYVTVSLPGAQRSLTICEVQVFGLPSEDQSAVVPTESSDISIFPPKLPFIDIWSLLEDFDYSSPGKEIVESDGDNLAFRGITSQSSTYDKFGASENAIDGSSNTRYMSGHCSHTDLDIEPWWRVDLTKVYNVTKVKITNRGDCCSERINGAEIRIGNSPEKGGTRNARCAKITTIGLGEEEEYICGIIGQYVTVTKPGGASYLTLCSVKVYGEVVPDNYTVVPVKPHSDESTENEEATEMRNILKHSNAAPNIATTGTTIQSSTGYKGESSKAVDGLLSTCSQTNEEQNPWWTLDLKSDHKVFSIAVTNRRESNATDLDGAEIHVGNSASGWKKNPICGSISSIGQGETFSFNCKGLMGRYVTIVNPDKVMSLSLCEVQVFALTLDTPSEDLNEIFDPETKHHGVKNVALQGFATQSSYYGSKYDARKAIDGSLLSNYMAGDCTHTQKQKDPWWRLDLKSTFRVSSVAITNRGDCCKERINGAEIRIGDSNTNGGINNPRCAVVFRMNYGETVSFNCKGMEGRYVTITKPNQKEFLSLCEVQVFAEPVEKSQEADPTAVIEVNPTAVIEVDPTAVIEVNPTAVIDLQDHEELTYDLHQDKDVSQDDTIDTLHQDVNLEGRYFNFPEASKNSYIHLSPAQPLSLTAYSLCMNLSLNVPENRETILFSYRSLYYDELNLWLEYSGKIGLYMRGESVMFPRLDRSKEWHHLCLTWESRHGRCELWVNGQRSGNKVFARRHRVNPGGIVLIGQDQDELGDGFDEKQSYIGKFKDLNMWNKVLSLKAIRQIYKNKEFVRGNIFDWSSLTYSIKGSVAVNSD